MNPILNAPSRPRGDIGRGSYDPSRDPTRRFGPPTGPGSYRGGFGAAPGGGRGRGGGGGPPFSPAFRGSTNSTSTTFPRTKHFTEHLADLSKPTVPGGKKIPSLVSELWPASDTKIKKLEEETERLRQEIADRESRSRAAIRDWDRHQRESDNARLRTELAEQSLAKLMADDDAGGSGF